MDQLQRLEEMIAASQRNDEVLAVELERNRRELARLRQWIERLPSAGNDERRDLRPAEPIQASASEESVHRATPRRGFLKIAGVLAALAGSAAISAPTAVSADTSVLVPYQGRLTDAAGTPLNGTFAVQFALYTVAAGGTPVWKEADAVTVTNGLFNAMLGSGNVLQASLFAANSALYLGITVGGDQKMTPRVLLGRAPYAAPDRERVRVVPHTTMQV